MHIALVASVVFNQSDAQEQVWRQILKHSDDFWWSHDECVSSYVNNPLVAVRNIIRNIAQSCTEAFLPNIEESAIMRVVPNDKEVYITSLIAPEMPKAHNPTIIGMLL